MSLPRAARPFVEFASVLRRKGFAAAPDQTIGFLKAVGILGPRDITDIYRAARALFGIPKDREAEFESLFRAYFLGHTVETPAVVEDGEEMQVREPTGSEGDVESLGEEEPGTEATAVERLGRRAMTPEYDDAALYALSRELPARLPRRVSARREPAKRGDSIDRLGSLRAAARTDGELLNLRQRRRKKRQRRILLMIDISGSMADFTADRMRFAHALTRAAERIEVFAFGTRLTRITPALRVPDRAMALERLARTVADFDGGTRIGEALAAFLAIPRFAGFARGATVMVLSDGLERDDPGTLIKAARRLSRLAWRLDWLTPLAADQSYRPETQAMRAILPHIDSLSDGSAIPALAAHALNLGVAR